MRPEDSHKALVTELTSGDENRAEAAARQLSALGEPVIPWLETLLRSDLSDDRWWAVRTLAEMKAPRADWLIRALADPSSEVRAAAALGLSAHPAAEAAPALVAVLGDEDSIVGILAVNALVAIGPAAVEPLLEAYHSFDQRARIQCMRALAELRDHRAIRLMMKAIEEESAILRYWAEQGLERLGLNMVYVKPE